MTNFLRAAFFVSLITTIIIAVMPDPPNIPSVGNDKALHIFVFIGTTILLWLAYPSMNVLFRFLTMVAFGGTLEMAQWIASTGRDPSLLDWIADVMAASAAMIIIMLFETMKSPRSK